MVSRHGRSVAAHFGSAASEAAVCLTTVGLADRYDRMTLELHGAPQDVDLALAGIAALRRHSWCSRRSDSHAIIRCESADSMGLDALEHLAASHRFDSAVGATLR